MEAVRRAASPIIFFALLVGAYAAALYARGIIASVESPEVLAGALVIDLVVLVPLAYYFLVVRRFRWPAVSVAGIFVLSLIAAIQIIPSEYDRVLTALEILAAVAEVAVLSFIAWKAVRTVRSFRAAAAEQQEPDTFHAIRVAAGQIVDSERVADALAYELAMMIYALGSWRQRFVEGPGRYTSYKRNSYGPVLAGIGVLLAVELIGVHLLVQHYWSTTGAWILSILTAYAGLWLLGDWQAQRLRPTVITNEALVLRSGLRWEVEIPFGEIKSFRRVSAIEDKPRDCLNLVVLGDALFEVTTDGPVEARGAYGMRKRTTSIWFTIDDADDFQERLSDHLPGMVGFPRE